MQSITKYYNIYKYIQAFEIFERNNNLWLFAYNVFKRKKSHLQFKVMSRRTSFKFKYAEKTLTTCDMLADPDPLLQ